MRPLGTIARPGVAIALGVVLALVISIAPGRGRSRAHPRAQVSHAPPLRQLVDSSEKQTGAMFGQRLRTLLANHRYDRLEAIADSLHAHDCRTPAGRSVEFSFYDDGFGDVDAEHDPQAWMQHLALIRAWADGHLESPVPRIALAHALFGRAWAARGGGYANTVTADGWRRFHADLAEANAFLEGCPRAARESAAWFDAKMLVLHALGTEADLEYRATYAEAVRRYPTDPRWYTGMSSHLMPRFCGEPGEFATYADTCGSSLPDSLRDELYARIATNQCGIVENPLVEYPGLSWERIQRGLDVWERRCSASITPLSARARFAIATRDSTLAVAAFERLGGRVDIDVWSSREWFLAVREWAFRAASPAGS